MFSMIVRLISYFYCFFVIPSLALFKAFICSHFNISILTISLPLFTPLKSQKQFFLWSNLGH
ncbi:hypothetical protein Hanom_Chr03g00267871 [Helianthus anomalus]